VSYFFLPFLPFRFKLLLFFCLTFFDWLSLIFLLTVFTFHYCFLYSITYVVIIIIFLYGLGRLTYSGIDALPSFPGASTISSSSRFAVESVFRESGVVHSFNVADPVLFVSESHVLYSRYLQFFSYDFASYFIQPFVSRNIHYLCLYFFSIFLFFTPPYNLSPYYKLLLYLKQNILLNKITNV